MLFRKRLYLILLVLFIILPACGKFTYSPYISNTKKEDINPKNIAAIVSSMGNFSNNFKVAIISDSHDYYTKLKKQIDYINGHKNDYAFVLHTGDATNLGLLVEWQTFKKFTDKLELPFVMILGNHDMLANGSDIYAQMFGNSLNFSFTFKQTKFIFINNNNWESSGIAPDLNYLEDELVSATSTHKVVLGHVQPDDTDRYTPTEINDMKSLIDTYNVNYFINGHNHNYGEGTFGNATRITAGSSHKDILLELIITDGGITHQFIKM